MAKTSRMTARLGRPFLLIAAILLLQSGVVVEVGAQQSRPDGRPNIVIILADDMGFADLGSFGGEIRTGSNSRLYTGGIR